MRDAFSLELINSSEERGGKKFTFVKGIKLSSDSAARTAMNTDVTAAIYNRGTRACQLCGGHDYFGAIILMDDSLTWDVGRHHPRKHV